MIPSPEEEKAIQSIEASEPRARRLEWHDGDELLAVVVVRPPRIAPGETRASQAFRDWVDALYDVERRASAANNLALECVAWPERPVLRAFLEASPEAVYTIADVAGGLGSPDRPEGAPDAEGDVVSRKGGEWVRASGAALSPEHTARMNALRVANPLGRLAALILDCGLGDELFVAKGARSARHHEARAAGQKGRLYDAAELYATGGTVLEPSAERFAAAVAERPGLILAVGGMVRDLGSPGDVKLGKARPSSGGQ